MKKLLFLPLFLLSLAPFYAQVVSGGSEIQPKTVEPSDLSGSSFNGDVNLFTGTYSGSYTLGSVATPGGLKYDVTMSYSSSLSGGDNVPVAAGIPYGEGWSVSVPTISVSVAEYKTYTDQQLAEASQTQSQVTQLDASKKFLNEGDLFWFAPTINIPGIGGGEAVFKWIDPVRNAPLFVLETFEQYIEIMYTGGGWEVYLPDGTTYFFTAQNVSFRKGSNRRQSSYDNSFDTELLGKVAIKNMAPKGEILNWNCSEIRNRNLPQQNIRFFYEGFGAFDFFKEFSGEYQKKLNEALRFNVVGSGFAASGYPDFKVHTNIFLKKVTSNHQEVIDQVELDYESFQDYGAEMLNYKRNDVERFDSLYNFSTVYYQGENTGTTPTTGNNQFTGWNRYLHAKHDDVQGINPTAFEVSPNNPYIGSNSNDSYYFKQTVPTGSNTIDLDHAFIESPRVNGVSGFGVPKIIGGDIYEIRTSAYSNPTQANNGYVNLDINIATGNEYDNGTFNLDNAFPVTNTQAVLAAKKDQKAINETIFSTFGNAIKWNPIANDNSGNVVSSNFFTMPNIPDDYEGLTIQIGPANSDNHFDYPPNKIFVLNDVNAHHSYYQADYDNNSGAQYHKKQIYDAVPSNFGIGLPWMMAKPLANRVDGNFNPNTDHEMFDFWWNDGRDQGVTYTNKPTLADQATIKEVELIRYSMNPYMLKSVKTYKNNGISRDTTGAEPGKILVNQFDLDYRRDSVDLINNVEYDQGSFISTTNDRQTNIYLLKNIKNIPVNSSQDATNPSTFILDEVPTTHFDYDVAIDPLIPFANLETHLLVTSSSKFLLSKLTSHLGKETAIEYYPFDDTADRVFTLRNINITKRDANPNSVITNMASRNFAAQFHIRVKSITVADDLLNPLPKRWDYEYNTLLEDSAMNFSGTLYDVNGNGSGTLFSPSSNSQLGWQTVKITEPEIEVGIRPYSIYQHHGEPSIKTPKTPYSNESLLFGKLKKVENFNGNGVKISENEIIYEVQKAFANGINRAGYSNRAWLQGTTSGDIIFTFGVLNGDTTWITTDTLQNPYVYRLTNDDTTYTFTSFPTSWIDLWTYDYHDYDETDPLTAAAHRTAINTAMGENKALADASTFLATRFPQFARDAYFIKKIKETSTEYEATTCNISDQTPIPLPGEYVPAPLGAIEPSPTPIQHVLSLEIDEELIPLIEENNNLEAIMEQLSDNSPLSDNVMAAILDKRPFFSQGDYQTIIDKQSIISDATFAKLLLLDGEIRDDVLQTALITQEYQVSIFIADAIITDDRPVRESIITNILNQYNYLPEATLLSIINRTEPSYSENLIESILLNKLAVSEIVHQLLLTKNYEQNFYEKVFKEGASYPADNVLIAMINSTEPHFENELVQNVLTASNYAHSPSVMSLIANRYNTAFNQVIATHNLGKQPNWAAYCSNQPDGNTLSIQNITQYEYWDANERGKTTCDGFKKLLNVTNDTISLKFEPSWQLYKTKSHSPQLAGAFTKQEYFYYYDLKNKYLRRQQYADPSEYLELTDLNAQFYYGLEGDILFLGHGVNGNQNLNLREFLPAGLERSHELNLLNVAYQEITTSKNVVDLYPVTRSTYFNYTKDWNELPSNPIDVRTFSDSTVCSVDSAIINAPNLDCISIYKIDVFDYSNVPSGWGVYADPINQKHWICPLDKDTVGSGLVLIYENPLTGNPVGNKISGIGALGQTLQLRNVITQIDTLVSTDYWSASGDIPFASASGLMEFSYEGVNSFGLNQYEVRYPYDVLTNKTILERNRFTQVQLEENERGLQTRYHYNHFKLFSYQNTACYDGSFSATESYNIGVPTAVIVGVNRPDSLRTAYEYYPDYSVKRIVDPNGINLSYTYDEFGRLKESFRNGDLLSTNKYSTWKNNTALSFNARTQQNSVETYQFKDYGSIETLHSQKFIDPLGRDYHTMSREEGTSNTLTVHTGQIVYDNWNRAAETYKPFVDGGGFAYTAQSTNSAYPNVPVLADYENDQKSRVTKEAKFGETLASNSHQVKYRYSMSNYVCGGCDLGLSSLESNLIMGANPGNVRFKIVEVEDEDGKMSQEYFNALGQKVATKQFITGSETAITLFVYDSYGNLTKVINPKKQESTYSYNMLGWMFQKQTVDGGITKYMYNESGQVVLEQDQRARNERSCELEYVLGENGEPSENPDYVDRPYYRSYNYDLFGRLTAQDRVNYESISSKITHQLPLLYADATKKVRSSYISGVTQSTGVDLFHNGSLYYLDLDATPSPINAFVYLFTNNSTYAWKGSTHLFSFGGASTPELTPYNNFDLAVNGASVLQPEKKFYYGENLTTSNQNLPINSSNIHSTSATILATARANMKGNLSHTITYSNSECEADAVPIQFDFMSYNSEGNLAWQMHQFNANGIRDSSKGIVTRIDYPAYDLNNNLLVENIDVNNDLKLDMQYGYSYDLRNRLREVRVSLDNDPTIGQLLASYNYNDATGLVTKTRYHKDCTVGNNFVVDEIDYQYDVRDRLTSMNGNYFNYSMFYDNDEPSTALGALAVLNKNFNGNINGIKSTYNLSSLGATSNNFDQPSSYAYEYDGINRLTSADAFWDETSTKTSVALASYGDVNYSFDNIGNLTHLKRNIDGIGGLNEWNYKYLAGSNKLNQVDALSSNTSDRNYTYDPAGNLLTDDYRMVNQTIYGRANLPFDLALEQNEIVKASQYLYDASDARIFKGLYEPAGTNQLGFVEQAEYYLRDAAGNTVGILDLNTQEWTWYVFGRERFAKIKPDVDQQPDFFTADMGQRDVNITEGNIEKDQFTQELLTILQQEEGEEQQLAMYHLTLNDETERWVSEINLPNFSDYRINNEITITGDKQLIRMDNELINTGVLTGGALRFADDNVTISEGAITRIGIDIIAITTGDTLTPDTTIVTDGTPLINYASNYDNEFISAISFYNFDHLGNTRIVYTPSNNECDPNKDPIFQTIDLDYAADYYPYGKTLREFNPKTEKYMNTMHERDQETGLTYAGARLIDHDVPHFLSLDPLAADFVSWSPYSYVMGNPVKFVDPDGKAPWVPDGQGGWTAEAGDGAWTLAEDAGVSFGEAKRVLANQSMGTYTDRNDGVVKSAVDEGDHIRIPSQVRTYILGEIEKGKKSYAEKIKTKNIESTKNVIKKYDSINNRIDTEISEAEKRLKNIDEFQPFMNADPEGGGMGVNAGKASLSLTIQSTIDKNKAKKVEVTNKLDSLNKVLDQNK